MAWILNGTNIRAPQQFSETNDKQTAQNRTLDGTVNRDHFGSKKRVWTLEYESAKTTDYNTINTLYNTYLSNSVPLTWEVTETNYSFTVVDVHVDLRERGFYIRGTDYLSDFTLVLTEV